MPVYLTARFAVRPDAREICERAIREFVDYIQATEPETRLYTSLRQADDETSYLHYFVFEDEAARQRHANSEGVRRFTDVLYPECVAPVEFTEFRLVAST